MNTTSYVMALFSREIRNTRHDEPSCSDDDSVYSSDEAIGCSEAWPRFLVVETLNNRPPITRVSPIIVNKAIDGIAGTPRDAKYIEPSDAMPYLLVECDNVS